MNTSLQLALVIAAIWSLYLAAVAATSVAVRDAHASRLVPAVAAGGMFVALATSLLAVAGMA